MYVHELTKRKYRGRQPRPIRGPDDVAAVIGHRLRTADREHFVVLLLNARHEVLAKETVSVGSLNASIVHPREVFKPALIQSAASVVLVHKRDTVTPAAILAENDGWGLGAVAAEVGRQLGGEWTARSVRTLAGTLRCGIRSRIRRVNVLLPDVPRPSVVERALESQVEVA